MIHEITNDYTVLYNSPAAELYSKMPLLKISGKRD